MNAEIAVQDILSKSNAYTSIVGSKIFYDEADQSQHLPFCIIKLDQIQPNDTHDGVSTLDFDYVYVTHFSSTKKECVAMATAARAVLDRKIGTHNGIVIEGSQYKTQRSDTELLIDKKCHTIEQLYQIMTQNGTFVGGVLITSDSTGYTADTTSFTVDTMQTTI